MNRSDICSSFGTVSVLWSAGNDELLVRRILLPGEARGESSSPDSAADGTSNAEFVRRITSDLERVLSGFGIVPDLSILSMDSCSEFQRMVLVETARIPSGTVITYGQIAGRIGKPSSARAVGRALAANPFPLLIPCHRVVGSRGFPGGYRGGVKMKRSLLEMEEIEFSPRGLCRPSSS